MYSVRRTDTDTTYYGVRLVPKLQITCSVPVGKIASICDWITEIPHPRSNTLRILG